MLQIQNININNKENCSAYNFVKERLSIRYIDASVLIFQEVFRVDFGIQKLFYFNTKHP